MEVMVTTAAVKSCRAPVKSSSPTNQHPAFYRSNVLPVAQLTIITHETFKLQTVQKPRDLHQTFTRVSNNCVQLRQVLLYKRRDVCAAGQNALRIPAITFTVKLCQVCLGYDDYEHNHGDTPEKNLPLASRLSRSLNVTGTDMDWSATYDFLFMTHSNQWVSEWVWFNVPINTL